MSTTDRLEMQNVRSLEAHGYKMVEGVDQHGEEMRIWRRSSDDQVVFGMYPRVDSMPYIIYLSEYGFGVTKR